MRRSVSKVEHGDYLTDLIAAEISALETLARSVEQTDIDKAADMIFPHVASSSSGRGMRNPWPASCSVASIASA